MLTSLDPSPTVGARLELVAVGDIVGRFVVPAYQRGYRWGAPEVDSLLNDIWENKERVYCLQPVVVKRKADEWELVDGQQRLTTLYLVFQYMQRAGLQDAGPRYTMRYETRPRSEAYLRDLSEKDKDDNIDFFHIHGAGTRIRDWFKARRLPPQEVANKFYEQLQKRVKVIWYEAAEALDGVELFTRLNVGRIALTNAELVKALLLTQDSDGSLVRPEEVAAQWDTIERELRDEDLWAFVTNVPPEAYPTRIELLFDLSLDMLPGGASGTKRVRFQAFDALRAKVSADREGFWRGVLTLHAMIREWYDDRELYHKVGYLVAEGADLAKLLRDASGHTRSAFKKSLDARIRERLGLTRAKVDEIRYDGASDAGYEKCARLLRLMNVETVRRLGGANEARPGVRGTWERYPFHAHKGQAWSIEHIHAQRAEGLTKKVQWQAWLTLHRDALAGLPVDEEGRGARDALIARIHEVYDDIDGETFAELAGKVTELFTRDAEEGDEALQSLHGITNLALLSSDANSALGNAVFEVKRRQILALDQAGEYIPICTRRVFLKYFTGANAQQVHLWSREDRKAYLGAILEVLTPYLTPEGAP